MKDDNYGMSAYSCLLTKLCCEYSWSTTSILYSRPSPILLAIGVPESVAQNAVRLSLGRHTTKSDIDIVVQDIKQAVTSLSQDLKLVP